MIPKKRRKKKRNWDEILSIGLLSILNLVIIVFLLVGNWKLYIKRSNLQAQIIDLEREVAALEKKNEELKKLFFEASQKEYLEKVIREKGLYKKPGEEVVVILKEKEKEAIPQEPTRPAGSIWQRIGEYFKKLFGL
jgi:cell division protein FtsB